MGEILTTISQIMCPHGGRAILLATNAKASTNGSFWLSETDINPIVGCPFCIGAGYSPCIRIEWSGGSNRTIVNGTRVLNRESIGICYNADNTPQGTAVVVTSQMRVITR
jgi:hypothetical protein